MPLSFKKYDIAKIMTNQRILFEKSDKMIKENKK